MVFCYGNPSKEIVTDDYNIYSHTHKANKFNDRDQEPDKEDEYRVFSLTLFLIIYIYI